MQPWALDRQDQIIVCIQSYVVRTAHHTILVDTCVGNDKSRPVDRRCRLRLPLRRDPPPL
jgi:hypothetical protein